MGARRDPLLLRSSSGSAPAGRFVPRAPLDGESVGSLAAGALWFSNSNSCQSDGGLQLRRQLVTQGRVNHE
jgi:hypothetical protein